VGVILYLAVTFAIVALFASVARGQLGAATFPLPDLSSVDVFACVVALIAFLALWRYRVNVLWVVVAGAAAGLVYRTLT
jgi:chromate transporter